MSAFAQQLFEPLHDTAGHLFVHRGLILHADARFNFGKPSIQVEIADNRGRGGAGAIQGDAFKFGAVLEYGAAGVAGAEINGDDSIEIEQLPHVNRGPIALLAKFGDVGTGLDRQRMEAGINRFQIQLEIHFARFASGQGPRQRRDLANGNRRARVGGGERDAFENHRRIPPACMRIVRGPVREREAGQLLVSLQQHGGPRVFPGPTKLGRVSKHELQ